jgi:hypothetical protein
MGKRRTTSTAFGILDIALAVLYTFQESMYLFARPDSALGGIGQTPLQPVVRIDYLQHTASAMARGLDLVPER